MLEISFYIAFLLHNIIRNLWHAIFHNMSSPHVRTCIVKYHRAIRVTHTLCSLVSSRAFHVMCKSGWSRLCNMKMLIIPFESCLLLIFIGILIFFCNLFISLTNGYNRTKMYVSIARSAPSYWSKVAISVIYSNKIVLCEKYIDCIKNGKAKGKYAENRNMVRAMDLRTKQN